MLTQLSSADPWQLLPVYAVLASAVCGGVEMDCLVAVELNCNC